MQCLICGNPLWVETYCDRDPAVGYEDTGDVWRCARGHQFSEREIDADVARQEVAEDYEDTLP